MNETSVTHKTNESDDTFQSPPHLTVNSKMATHLHIQHDSFLNETWLILIWDMTSSHMRQTAMHTWDATNVHMRRHSSAYATWLVLICDMTHSRMKHFAICQNPKHDVLFSVSVTWLNHSCDMTQSFLWHDSIIPVTRLNHSCDKTQSDACLDSFTPVTLLIHMCDMTYVYSHMGVMGHLIAWSHQTHLAHTL